MTFTDDGPGIDGNPGKKLASFELQKASARGVGGGVGFVAREFYVLSPRAGI